MLELGRNLYHSLIGFCFCLLIPIVKLSISRAPTSPRITCDRNDGGGAQIHGRISVIAFAKAFGLQYVHTPLRDVHFSLNNDVARWNKLIDFTEFGSEINEDVKVIKFTSMPKLLAFLVFGLPRIRSRIIQVEHCHGFTDRFPNTISDLRPSLRKAYKNGLKSSDSTHAISITEDAIIHFRGLVGPETDDSPRLSSVPVIRKKIEAAKLLRKSKQSRIVCISPSEDLLNEIDDTFIIDTESEVHFAFKLLAEAKFAFLAKSSLSYVAGLINENAVFYEDFWHPRMHDWNTL